jgi:hypothetical protein
VSIFIQLPRNQQEISSPVISQNEAQVSLKKFKPPEPPKKTSNIVTTKHDLSLDYLVTLLCLNHFNWKKKNQHQASPGTSSYESFILRSILNSYLQHITS